MLSVVATRYAKALVDVITAPGSRIEASRVLNELRSTDAIIAGSTDLRNILLSPAVPPSRKRAVMARLVEPMGLTKQVRNFIFVLIGHRRIPQFASIVDAFEMLLDDRLGYVRADISSAGPLTDTQRANLEAQLSRLAGKTAKLQFTTDASLIGGVVARVGSTVYDGSVRGQMERLRAKLASG
jgi:F-type H+-transporting ATPase subunit delta